MGITYTLSPLDLELQLPRTTENGVKTHQRNLLVAANDGVDEGYGEIFLADTPTHQYPLRREDIPSRLLSKQHNAIFPIKGLDQDLRDECHYLPHERQLRSGVEMALVDLYMRRHGRTLRSFVEGEHQSYVTFDPPDSSRVKTGAALEQLCGYATKVKVLLGTDETANRFLLSVMGEMKKKRSFILDLGGLWSPLDVTRNITLLRNSGAHVIEQPFPYDLAAKARSAKYASLLLEWRQVHTKLEANGMRLYADESILDMSDMTALDSIIDGVVLKLEKNGGIARTMMLARHAKHAGLGVMIGSNITSRHSMGAAMLLAKEADHLAIEGPCRVKDDPFVGVDIYPNAPLILPETPGLSQLRKY